MAVEAQAVARELPQRERAVLLVAAGAAFLALLDTTVANMAVADVRNDFGGASVGGATWIITIYAVTFAALLAPAGRIADVVGRRTLMLAGISVFTTMSLVCAAAPSLGALLVARALQGAGAAAMIPASLAIVLFDTPAERRAAAIGAWSAAGALAAAAGPAISGVLVDLEGWRSLFAINLPFGVAIVAGAIALPAGATGEGRLPDALGTALLGAGIGALALGIAQGPDWGWGSAQVVAALTAGAFAFGAALWRSLHHATPAIETRLWRTRSFAVANLASLLYGAALFPWLLVGVLFLIQVWGYSPLEAGLAMTPGAIVAAVIALRAGRIVAKRGVRAVVVGGALVLGVAGLLGAFALPASPSFVTYWLPVGVLIGVGTGAITTGLSAAAALSVAPQRFAAAIGLNQTGRQVGGALGVAVLAALLHGRSAPGSGVGPFPHVYLFCTLATVAAAVAALWLSPKEEP
ncbi:MAG TPA: MFS transporter [Thermoleophilaceae bacterium]|jgi:EmrB/QacA subfamily drug resistance transporter|nr:MFS transporter [Thermoleophilaceae bacterium]